MGKDYIFKAHKTFLGKLAFRTDFTKSVFFLTFATIGKSKCPSGMSVGRQRKYYI